MKNLVLVCVALLSSPALAQDLIWIDQFGTSGFDTGAAVATDADDIYVAGRIDFQQALPGQTNVGSLDAFLRKYDSDGNEQWTRQFGTTGAEFSRDVTVYDGNVFVTGDVYFPGFPGEQYAGFGDVYIRQFDAFGNAIWTSQFGTSGRDIPLGLTVTPAGIYILGTTAGEFAGETALGGRDLFLAKLDHIGNLIWVRQFGTTGDDPSVFLLSGIAADESGVYIGSTAQVKQDDPLASVDSDAFVRKYDHNGIEVWTRQFGTRCYDALHALTLGPDGVYVAGVTDGKLARPLAAQCEKSPNPAPQPPGSDTFVRAYTVNGSEIWTQQDGGPAEASDFFSQAIDIVADGSGVYVAGEITEPGLLTHPNPAECEVFPLLNDIRIRAYDLSGSVRWTQSFGTTGTTVPGVQGIAIQGSDLVVVGSTQCPFLGEASAGSVDAFVMKVEADQ